MRAEDRRTNNRGLALELRGVQKRFGVKAILRGIDLMVSPGEFVAIVGKSGCGKSTLLRLIAGLDAPTQGELRADGLPIRGLNSAVRVMFQEARLLPWKRVLENVALGLPSSEREQAADALTQVGLADRASDWPAILSGGQKQRVALARALCHRPRLLLLDEPLGALDALTRLEMQERIETLWRQQNFTALLVTHDIEEAVALADRVIVLEAGEIAAEYRVDLPRPRRRDSGAFARLKGEVLARVMGRLPAETFLQPECAAELFAAMG